MEEQPQVQPIGAESTVRKSYPSFLIPFLVGSLLVFIALTLFFGYQYTILRYATKIGNEPSEVMPTITTAVDQIETSVSPIQDQTNSGWQTITSDVLGVELMVPATLTPDQNNMGEVPGEIGFQYCLTYNGDLSLRLIPQVQAGGGPCDGGTLTLGAVTTDYEAGRGGGFGDMQSFRVKDGTFLITRPPSQEFEISPTLVREMTNQYNMKILMITGMDERTEMFPDGIPVLGTPGEGKIGAIINLPNNSQYAGFTLQMEINKSDDRRVFDQILESIRPL